MASRCYHFPHLYHQNSPCSAERCGLCCVYGSGRWGCDDRVKIFLSLCHAPPRRGGSVAMSEGLHTIAVGVPQAGAYELKKRTGRNRPAGLL